jgi:hypothetical protein
VVVGSRSMRVIDLVLEILPLGSWGMEDIVTRSQELQTHDS